MSAYAVNKVCRLAHTDDDFRQRLAVDPEATLQSFVPRLTEEEATAFLAGDVAALCAFGAHRYLLSRIASRRLFGLDRERYVERLRQAFAADPAARTDISR